jgi:hypothetical protein
MSPDGAVHLELTAGPVADAVARRVIGAVGAQGTLPIDRIHDALIAIDMLLDAVVADRLHLSVTPRAPGLEIAIGPVDAGQAERIVGEASEIGAVLRGLTDRVWTDPSTSPAAVTVCVAIGAGTPAATPA